MIGNFALFQAVWFAAVLGAAAGLVMPVLGALLLLLSWGPLLGGNWRPDARMALAGLAVGLIVEPLWLYAGLIEYRLQTWPLIAPIWILALWVGFAVCFNYSLAWLRGRVWLAVIFGGVGSALSVWAGVRFGAAQAPLGMAQLALAYGAVWAIVVPLLAWWADRSGHAINGKRMTDGPGSMA